MPIEYYFVIYYIEQVPHKYKRDIWKEKIQHTMKIELKRGK